jgi:hypothetical protein
VKHKIIPEMREMMKELALLEESPAMCALLEDSKKFGYSDENRSRFWCTLRELLLPHQALYQRMDELLRKQIEAAPPGQAGGPGRPASAAGPRRFFGSRLA